MLWWDCNGFEYGPVKYFPNADPTGYIWLSRYTKTSGYRFCLAAYSEGNDPTDTFTADLSYDG